MTGEYGRQITARWLLDHGLRGLTSETPSRLVAVDPPGCGCTECMTGEYVPLNEASPEQLAKLFAGDLRNNTGLVFAAEPGQQDGTVHVVPYFEDGPAVADADLAESRWRSVADGWTLEVER